MPLKNQNPQEPLEAKITLRVTKKEKEKIAEFAELANIPLSEVIRRCYFGKKLVVNNNDSIVRELRRQGGLIKMLHMDSGGAYSELTATALKEITKYVELLRRQK